MEKQILYIFRGDKSWMISFRGMPEEEDMLAFLAGSARGVVATRFARDADVEVVLKEVKAKNPAYEVKLLNWDKPKRDYEPDGTGTQKKGQATFSMAFQAGDYVRQTSQPNWGIGRVLWIGEREKVAIFFLRGGKRTFTSSSAHLEQVEDPRHPILEIAGTANWNRVDRNLYVVELDSRVFEREQRFAEANQHWIPGKLCVYVGITGITPEERFGKHKSGHKAAWFVRRYGRRLLPEFYQNFNPLPYELGKAMEPELAQQLRADGHAVWQN